MLRDILGDRATNELTEELNTLYEQFKVLGWREVRPWGEFFGGFKLPELTAKSLEDRVVTNLLHYRSNYAVVCSVLLLLQVFLSPMLLVAVPLALVFCIYLLVVHKRPIKCGDIKIRDTQKQAACAIFCLFFFAITGVLERLVWIIIYWVFTIGLHLILRPRTMSSKANKMYEEMKLNGYMDWFGGGGGSERTTPAGSPFSFAGFDPENPTERERDPEVTRFHAASSAGAPYGYSSNLGTGSAAAAVDMRKRGGGVGGTGAGTSGVHHSTQGMSAASSGLPKKD